MHVRTAILLGVVVAAMVMTGAAKAATRSCAEVPYTPGTTVASSHYGASSIKATGVSCSVARALAKRAKDSGPFRSRSFSCSRKLIATANYRWTCKRAKPRARVTFTTIG